MFNVNNDIHIRLLLCASNMKIFFSNVSRIAFTDINTIAPPKSCVNILPARNKFKATLFLFCLKKLL